MAIIPNCLSTDVHSFFHFSKLDTLLNFFFFFSSSQSFVFLSGIFTCLTSPIVSFISKMQITFLALFTFLYLALARSEWPGQPLQPLRRDSGVKQLRGTKTRLIPRNGA